MNIVKENLNESYSFWRMETMPGTKTSVYPANSGMVYCFKTSFDLKDIFNSITQRNKSAVNWKRRFHWDKNLKMWCTQSMDSANEAEQILKQRVGPSMQTADKIEHGRFNRPDKIREPEQKPVSEPIKKLNPNEYDLSTDYLHYNKKEQILSAEMGDLPSGFSTKHKLIVYNPNTGNTKTFTHYKNDTDGSGEDIYGYRYRSQDGIELLIIND